MYTLAIAQNEPIITDGNPMSECIPVLVIDDDENINDDIEVEEKNE